MTSGEKGYITRKTNKFMESVKNFLKKKSGGEIPDEWEASLMILEEYYKLFVQLTLEIEKLDSFLVPSKYGQIISPLIGARDSAARRLESMMGNLGLTLKSAIKLDMTEVEVSDSPLETFLAGNNNNVEKR